MGRVPQKPSDEQRWVPLLLSLHNADPAPRGHVRGRRNSRPGKDAEVAVKKWRSRLPRLGLGRLRRQPGARQIEKLVPQPHEAVALGLITRKDEPIRSSTKSISEPAM